VSVVVVNHDYGRFLEAAIDSALAQSHAATEVIVVDDGSTDDSRDRIAGYRDRVVPVFKENGGQASAFNAGFEASRGEFVLFLDADDLLLPAAAETAALSLSDGEAAKVHWRLWQIDEFGCGPDAAIRSSAWERERPARARDPPRPEQLRQPAHVGQCLDARLSREGCFPCPRVETSTGPMPTCRCWRPSMAPSGGRSRRAATASTRATSRAARSSTRITHDLRRYRSYCEIMRDHLGRMGRSVDPDAWKGPESVYAWMEGVRAGTGEIAAVVPRGDTIILADDAQWGGGGAIAGRRCLPFLERNGAYFGAAGRLRDGRLGAGAPAAARRDVHRLRVTVLLVAGFLRRPPEPPVLELRLRDAERARHRLRSSDARAVDGGERMNVFVLLDRPLRIEDVREGRAGT
jgi:hypothetical protein